MKIKGASTLKMEMVEILKYSDFVEHEHLQQNGAGSQVAELAKPCGFTRT